MKVKNLLEIFKKETPEEIESRYIESAQKHFERNFKLYTHSNREKILYDKYVANGRVDDPFFLYTKCLKEIKSIKNGSIKYLDKNGQKISSEKLIKEAQDRMKNNADKFSRENGFPVEYLYEIVDRKRKELKEEYIQLINFENKSNALKNI